ncbi:hypothetical protein FKP32DRAFT_1589536, partial [Trametes sanguinea]
MRLACSRVLLDRAAFCPYAARSCISGLLLPPHITPATAAPASIPHAASVQCNHPTSARSHCSLPNLQVVAYLAYVYMPTLRKAPHHRRRLKKERSRNMHKRHRERELCLTHNVQR